LLFSFSVSVAESCQALPEPSWSGRRIFQRQEFWDEEGMCLACW